MRLSLHLFGLHVLELEATTDDGSEDESLRPPMGFAGGSGLHTEVHEPMLDNVQSD